jgi:hypothetical protein
MAIRQLAIDVEAELGQLDGRLAIEVERADVIDALDIMPGNGLGFAEVPDVFAQAREHGLDAVTGGRPGGGDHLLERLAGHELRDRAPDERDLGAVGAKPLVVGDLEEDRARDAHALIILIVRLRRGHSHLRLGNGATGFASR